MTTETPTKKKRNTTSWKTETKRRDALIDKLARARDRAMIALALMTVAFIVAVVGWLL